jgi:hypothetical protein
MKHQHCDSHGEDHCHEHADHSCCSHHSHHSHQDCCHEHQDFAHHLTEMADEAWMEVLKEKIKANIVKTHGSHLDELAAIVAQSNGERWKSKMTLEKTNKDFKEKVAAFFKT